MYNLQCFIHVDKAWPQTAADTWLIEAIIEASFAPLTTCLWPHLQVMKHVQFSDTVRQTSNGLAIQITVILRKGKNNISSCLIVTELRNV